jgi:hypothetical protein
MLLLVKEKMMIEQQQHSIIVVKNHQTEWYQIVNQLQKKNVG